MQKTNLQRALDLSHNIFIQACAGAGKTFALTKRYCTILDEFAEASSNLQTKNWQGPQNILVITFTKKAAGEMSQRIYSDLRSLISGQIPDNLDKQNIIYCPHLRDRHFSSYHSFLQDAFSRHAISTIDSFCTGILKEYAHLIDLDPQFLTLEDMESRRLFDETLDSWLKKTSADRHPSLDCIARNYSLYNFRNALHIIASHREQLETTLKQMESRTEDEIWQDWLNEFTPDFDLKSLCDSINDLWQFSQTACSNKKDACYKALENIRQELNNMPKFTSDQEKRAWFISSLLMDSGFTKKNKPEYYAKAPGNKSNWNDKRQGADDFYALLQSTLPEHLLGITPGPSDKLAIPVLKALAVLYRDFDTYYETVKHQRNVLDFSDIIILTRKLLLENPEVAKELSLRYSHILVDEFQDTNPARWDIIRCIASEDNALRSSGLFVVGDRKQSIYRFNNADVTIMNEAETLIEQSGGDAIQFDDNYRAVPEFVNEGINEIFTLRDLFPGKDDKRENYEAFFEASISQSTRPVSLKPVLNADFLQDDDLTPAQEAEFTAKTVSNIIQDLKAADLYDENKIMIGVLLRDFNRISYLQTAFNEKNIPHHIVSGRGFFQTNAARDIGFFLNVMCNPHDDFHLLGLLRSPIIGLSDAQLYRLAGREGLSLFKALQNDKELDFAAKKILRWQNDLSSATSEEVLIHILDKEMHQLGYICEQSPEQSLANIDKAIHLVRKQMLNGAGLSECRDLFNENCLEHLRESQAAYPSRSPVEIMTIHKAKGLEFPVVVLPDMNRRNNTNTDNLRYGHVDSRQYISLKPEGAEKPGVVRHISALADKEEFAEKKRLFYVAVTRAVHQVYFLGAGNKIVKNSDWATFVMPVFNLDESPEDWRHPQVKTFCYSQIRSADAAAVPEKKTFSITYPADTSPQIHTLSPHDLMPHPFTQPASGSVQEYTCLATAVGTCFHACMEYDFWTTKGHEKKLCAHFSDLSIEDQQAVLSECETLLVQAGSQGIKQDLADSSSIYRELAVSGRLKSKKHILLVNGIIDCLYLLNGQWIVLDYKTDKDDSQLENYRHQIRSYLWMVKQLFNISATGKLYFVRLNKTLSVDWDETYFSTLPYSAVYSAEIQNSQLPLPSMDKQFTRMICPGNYCARQLKNSLACAGKYYPDLQISTLNQLLNDLDPDPVLSPRQMGMILQHHFKDLSRGQANLLASACYSEQQGKGKMKADFAPYGNYLIDYCKKNNYTLLQEKVQNAVRQLKSKPENTYIYSPLPVVPVMQKILSALQPSYADKKPDPLPDKKQSFIQAFSPREEVLLIAGDIAAKKLSPEDVLITCSSMDVYSPHIERIFPQFGLSAFFSDRISYMNSPYASLVLALAKIQQPGKKKWSDLSAVFLHPLLNTPQAVYDHDARVMKNPFKSCALPAAVTDTMDKYIQPQQPFSSTLKAFFKDGDLLPDSNRDHNKEMDSILNVVTDLEKDISQFHLTYSASRFYSELNDRLKQPGLRRSRQQDGIHICSFLNSMGSSAANCYVMGMTNDMIPRHEVMNPYFKLSSDLSYDLNRHFFDSWCRMSGQLIFTAPQQSEDGSPLQISMFLEQAETQPYKPAQLAGLREKLLSYSTSIIPDKNSPLFSRFNSLQISDGQHSGHTNMTMSSVTASATSLDHLLSCPMKYFIQDVLHVREPLASEDIVEKMNVGNTVHSILEEFGKAGGFDLPIKDQAAKLLSTVSVDILNDFQLDIDDPITFNRYKYYLDGLDRDSADNLLLRIIKWNKTFFKDFRADKFEWEFNSKNNNALILDSFCIPVILRGKIDKILVDESNKTVLASDYKTGEIQNGDFTKFLKSQLYVYMKKLKQDYPDHQIKSAYEIIQKPEKSKKPQIINIEDNMMVLTGASKMNISEFEDYLNEQIKSIASGDFPLTWRPEKESCSKCAFRGICRKC